MGVTSFLQQKSQSQSRIPCLLRAIFYFPLFQCFLNCRYRNGFVDVFMCVGITWPVVFFIWTRCGLLQKGASLIRWEIYTNLWTLVSIQTAVMNYNALRKRQCQVFSCLLPLECQVAMQVYSMILFMLCVGAFLTYSQTVLAILKIQGQLFYHCEHITSPVIVVIYNWVEVPIFFLLFQLMQHLFTFYKLLIRIEVSGSFPS